MDPLTAAAVLGGVGLLKSEFIDRPREDRQRKMAAVTARWSPWTGMSPNQIQEADPFGTAIQGGLAGAMIGQANSAGAAKTGSDLSLAGGSAPQSTSEVLAADEMGMNQSMMSPLQRQAMMNRSAWYAK